MSAGLDIPVGTTATASVEVTREITVAHHSDAMPEVYGTPYMIFLMEVAAARAIEPFLPPGSVSVGVEVKVRHLAATPIGFTATASAKVLSVEGRLVTFAVEVHDGVELIGEGTHVRGVVDFDRFTAKVAAKAAR